jgi:hypothetical protein
MAGLFSLAPNGAKKYDIVEVVTLGGNYEQTNVDDLFDFSLVRVMADHDSGYE